MLASQFMTPLHKHIMYTFSIVLHFYILFFLFFCQFTCDREDLLKCVAGQLNISDSVTLCLLYNLTGLVEDPFFFCTGQPSACPLPEVSVCDHLYMYDVCTICLPTASTVSCSLGPIKKNDYDLAPVFMVTVWSHVVWWCCSCASSISHTVCCWLCCAAQCSCTSAV